MCKLRAKWTVDGQCAPSTHLSLFPLQKDTTAFVFPRPEIMGKLAVWQSSPILNGSASWGKSFAPVFTSHGLVVEA